MPANSIKYRSGAAEAFTGEARPANRAVSLTHHRHSRGHRARARSFLAGTSALALVLAISQVAADEFIDGGQTVSVPGDQNSPWNIVGNLYVGNTGAGTLIVENGGIVTAGSFQLGELPGSHGTIAISGVGSSMSANGITVGDEGTGVLTVADGADLILDGTTWLGFIAGGEGTLSVTGQGTSWVSNFNVVVGGYGKGAVTIADGASAVHGEKLYVGGHDGTNPGGGQVTVTGQGTSWKALDDAHIGTWSGGTLTISDGATFDVAQSLLVGDENWGESIVGEGFVTVTGQGSKLTYGAMTVGRDGNGTLHIEDGGTVGSTGHDIALGDNATGQASVRVAGSGSTLSASSLWVGNWGTGSLTVENGGLLTSDNNVYLGRQAGGSGAVNVTGAASSWMTASSILVGLRGTGVVTVSDGGTIEASGSLRLGEIAGSNGFVAVTGAGSSLTIGGWARVGGQSDGAMSVEDGASVVQAEELEIGAGTGVTGTAVVTGEGSSWEVQEYLVVGAAGSGALTVSDGGTFSVVQDAVVAELTGSDGTLRVNGGSLSAQALNIGGQGEGILVIEGGTVTADGGAGTVQLATDIGSQGILAIGNGGKAGSLEAALVQFGAGTGRVLFAHDSTAYAFDAAFDGGGTIEHHLGDTILTADSSGFTGTTTVSGGMLSVNGILGGAIDVTSGGTLGGSGTVNAVAVASGGTLAPGNSIGTLNVASAVFDAGSTFEVEINSAGQSDLIDATGTATIDGGRVEVVPFPDYALDTPYTILTAAGGVSGVFDELITGIGYLFLTPMLSYDPNSVYLTIDQTASFESAGLTSNQKAAAAGADSLAADNGLWSAVALIGTEAEAQIAFDAISGEIHASAKTALIEDSRFVREAATNRVRAAFGAVGAPAMQVMAYGPDGLAAEDEQALARQGKSAHTPADTQNFVVWSQAFGSWGETDGDGNAASLERSTGGGFVGADGLVADIWRLGLLAGYSRSSFDVDDRASSGEADNYHLGIYGGTQAGALGFRFGATYTWHDIETERTVAFPGFADSVEASYNAGTAQAFGELGYRIDTEVASFEPFAGLAYVNFDSDGFTEVGGAAALTSDGGSTDATFTTLGLRAATGFTIGTTRATARGMLGWRHAFGDTAPLSTHAFVGGNVFTIAGAPISQDAAIVEAGLDIDVTPAATLGLSYSGQFASDAQDHGFKADFNLRF